MDESDESIGVAGWGGTAEKHSISSRHPKCLRGWFLGHPDFFFYILFVFPFPFTLHLSSSHPLLSVSLCGSSVWLFIGNDSHCGRAPLRLRSPPPPPPHHRHPHPQSLHPHPPPSFSPIRHALFMESQSNEGTTVGSKRHGAWLFLSKSPLRCPSLVPTITHPLPLTPAPAQPATSTSYPSDKVTDFFIFFFKYY